MIFHKRPKKAFNNLCSNTILSCYNFRFVSRVHCPMTFMKFPFDRQSCLVKLQSCMLPSKTQLFSCFFCKSLLTNVDSFDLQMPTV